MCMGCDVGRLGENEEMQTNVPETLWRVRGDNGSDGTETEYINE